jgi:hypothetical protein
MLYSVKWLIRLIEWNIWLSEGVFVYSHKFWRNKNIEHKEKVNYCCAKTLTFFWNVSWILNSNRPTHRYTWEQTSLHKTRTIIEIVMLSFIFSLNLNQKNKKNKSSKIDLRSLISTSIIFPLTSYFLVWDEVIQNVVFLLHISLRIYFRKWLKIINARKRKHKSNNRTKND